MQTNKQEVSEVGGYPWNYSSHCLQIMEILRRLAPGSFVSVYFDNSGFRPTYFQFLRDDEAAFSGGSLDGGLTYIKADQILAIKVGS